MQACASPPLVLPVATSGLNSREHLACHRPVHDCGHCSIGASPLGTLQPVPHAVHVQQVIEYTLIHEQRMRRARPILWEPGCSRTVALTLHCSCQSPELVVCSMPL